MARKGFLARLFDSLRGKKTPPPVRRPSTPPTNKGTLARNRIIDVNTPDPGRITMREYMSQQRTGDAAEFVNKMESRYGAWRRKKGATEEETLAARNQRIGQIAIRWSEMGLGLDDLYDIQQLSPEEIAQRASASSLAMHSRRRVLGQALQATDEERTFFYHGGT